MDPNLYNRDPDDNKSYQKTVAMCVAAASMVLLLFLVILYVNSDNGAPAPKADKTAAAEKENEKEEDDILKESHNITSDELEFWDDAKKPQPAQKEDEGEVTPYKDPNADQNGISDKKDEPDDTVSTTDKGKTLKKYNENADTYIDNTDELTNSTTDKTGRDNNGDTSVGNRKDRELSEINDRDKDNYIEVIDDKGKKRYYEILSDVPKNDYDLENDLYDDNGTIVYKDSRRESIKGVDLSKYNGNVDFTKLKEKGIGFAMLRLGSRGYGTGNISLDEKFVEYAQNAQLAGIQIGAYFYSQAVNETEAIEEANYIVGAVSGFNLKYPIAIDIEKVEQDQARTDDLTDKDRTAIVKAFCDAVKGYGYKPIIYASKDMLVSGLNLEELTDYDVWLSDSTLPTDYPYRFSMWQYNKRGRIDGITGDIDLDISFIDYERK